MDQKHGDDMTILMRRLFYLFSITCTSLGASEGILGQGPVRSPFDRIPSTTYTDVTFRDLDGVLQGPTITAGENFGFWEANVTFTFDPLVLQACDLGVTDSYSVAYAWEFYLDYQRIGFSGLHSGLFGLDENFQFNSDLTPLCVMAPRSNQVVSQTVPIRIPYGVFDQNTYYDLAPGTVPRVGHILIYFAPLEPNWPVLWPPIAIQFTLEPNPYVFGIASSRQLKVGETYRFALTANSLASTDRVVTILEDEHQIDYIDDTIVIPAHSATGFAFGTPRQTGSFRQHLVFDNGVSEPVLITSGEFRVGPALGVAGMGGRAMAKAGGSSFPNYDVGPGYYCDGKKPRELTWPVREECGAEVAAPALPDPPPLCDDAVEGQINGIYFPPKCIERWLGGTQTCCHAVIVDKTMNDYKLITVLTSKQAGATVNIGLDVKIISAGGSSEILQYCCYYKRQPTQHTYQVTECKTGLWVGEECKPLN